VVLGDFSNSSFKSKKGKLFEKLGNYNNSEIDTSYGKRIDLFISPIEI